MGLTLRERKHGAAQAIICRGESEVHTEEHRARKDGKAAGHAEVLDRSRRGCVLFNRVRTITGHMVSIINNVLSSRRQGRQFSGVKK